MAGLSRNQPYYYGFGNEADICYHLYQRPIDGFLFVYNIADLIVLFSIINMVAKRYAINIVSSCIMVDHIHLLVREAQKKIMTSFVRDYTSIFVREFNRAHGLKGSMFKDSLGMAKKVGNKAIRTCVSYINNNPVEKKLCQEAQNSRLNFLAYGASSHPFSEKISYRTVSRKFIGLAKAIKRMADEGKYLKYYMVNGILDGLSEREKKQMADFMISAYNTIDYEYVIKLYGSYENLLIAVNSNSGSEYDLKEEYTKFSDTAYSKFTKVLKDMNIGTREILSLSAGTKKKLLRHIELRCRSPIYQIRKYLHIKKE